MTGRILVVDDLADVRNAHERVLTTAGFNVVTAESGADALVALDREPFDVVVSDISMPKMSGIELLRCVRQRDLDMPVLLVTGVPSVESAIEAVALGAFRYLEKPVDLRELREAVGYAARIRRMAALKREALELIGQRDGLVGDRTGLEVAFDRALATLRMDYQPIVRAGSNDVYGYEALVRSDERSLPTPTALLNAADSVGRSNELGQAIRRTAVQPVTDSPECGQLFVNLRPSDLSDDELYSEDAPLSRVAGRVVLEITDRSRLDDVGDVRGRVARLRNLGFRIAIDDLGVGFAGLSTFALLEPEVVKIDVALVHNLNASEVMQRVVQSMIKLCRELGTLVLAEGVETPAEHQCLRDLGCDLLQGYLFARPGPAFPRIPPVVDERCSFDPDVLRPGTIA